MSQFNEDVTSHSDNQHRRQYVQLGIRTDRVAVGECYNESDRLPESIIGEGRLRLGRKQTAVESLEPNKEQKYFVIVLRTFSGESI